MYLIFSRSNYPLIEKSSDDVEITTFYKQNYV